MFCAFSIFAVETGNGMVESLTSSTLIVLNVGNQSFVLYSFEDLDQRPGHND